MALIVCYGYWDFYPYLYYICVFILSPITPSHPRQFIYRFVSLYDHIIAFRTLIMYLQIQDFLILFPKVILQTPFAFIILFNILGHLTIHLLDIFQII